MHDLRVAVALIGSLLFLLPAACDGDSETGSPGNGSGATTTSVGPTSSTGGGSTTASTGVGGSSGDAVADWCNAVIGPFCDALFACCSDPQVLDNYGDSAETCKTTWGARCVADLGRDISPLVASGSSVLDTQRMAACVAKLEGMAAGGTACTEPPILVMLTDCIPAFEGQVPPGQPCVTTPDDISYIECSHGLCQGGQCVALGQQGEPCVSLCDYTVGLWCSFDGMNSSCEPRGNLGDPCTHVAPGEPNYECLSLNCGTNGMCELPTAEMACESS